MQYTEQELSQLIKNLETEFSAHIAEVTGAAQPTSLAKAEDEKPEGESKDKPAESKPKAKESEEEKPKDAPAAPAAEAKEGEAAPAAPAEEAPVAPAADEGASGYDADDIAHMDQMYMSMSKAELIAHHDSCVRALDSMGAEHSHAQAPAAPGAEQAAPAAPAAPAAEIDKCGDMSMGKSEDNKNVELELAKSEAASEKAKAETLQKNLDVVQEFLTKLVKKVPQGKAITSLEQVAKSEGSTGDKELTKAEIDSKLLAKSADPKLAKTDRDAINAFYLNNANFNTISHLLK
jgi:hypothetical protein